MAQKLPEEFQNQMKRLLGEAGFFAYLNALDEPYTRALRINLLLRPDGTPPCAIEGLGAPVPWAKGAYFIEGDARPGLSPLHEGGLFYMQEPSALTAVTVLDPQPGERVLDLCAAPGGKSTQIAALMGGQGLLVCNEPVPNRAQILSRNVERMGCATPLSSAHCPMRLRRAFRRSLTAYWSMRPVRERACSAVSPKRVMNGTPIPLRIAPTARWISSVKPRRCSVPAA